MDSGAVTIPVCPRRGGRPGPPEVPFVPGFTRLTGTRQRGTAILGPTATKG